MSELQKHYVRGYDLHAESSWCQQDCQSVYYCTEADARLVLMQRAIEWLMKHCIHHHGGTIFRGYLQGTIEVPAEFADIIKGTTHV